MAMGFSAMFLNFSWITLEGKHCLQHPIAVMGVVDTFGPYVMDDKMNLL
jgi:hypothetical protein